MTRPAIWQALIAVLLLAFVATGCSGFFVEPQLQTITVSPASPSLVTGGTQQFTAIGTYDDGSTSVLGSAAWSTSNVAVLTVHSTSGMGTAIGAGSATVSATSGAATGSTTVTVETSPLSSITISPVNPSVSLASTTTQQFTATANFTDGSSRDVSSSVTWSSSATAIATINSTGLATLIKAGTTTIKATSGTVTQQTTLTVVP